MPRAIRLGEVIPSTFLLSHACAMFRERHREVEVLKYLFDFFLRAGMRLKAFPGHAFAAPFPGRRSLSLVIRSVMSEVDLTPTRLAGVFILGV